MNVTFVSALFGVFCLIANLQADYNDFETNPYITADARVKIKPYLLPENHPAKETLDQIFKKSRASLNDKALENAGFHIKYKQPRSFVRVVSHPDLPGYLLKIVTDAELQEKHHKPAWHWFVNRCVGVEKIHKAIKKHHVKLFVAPNKWIYPLPLQPYPAVKKSDYKRKTVVLLVDDMHLVRKEDNKAAWKHKITKAHLKELYAIIKDVGGHSYRAENIPLTNKGKFAFIDTEYPSSPPKFKDIRSYLSGRNQVYWDSLVY